MTTIYIAVRYGEEFTQNLKGFYDKHNAEALVEAKRVEDEFNNAVAAKIDLPLRELSREYTFTRPCAELLKESKWKHNTSKALAPAEVREDFERRLKAVRAHNAELAEKTRVMWLAHEELFKERRNELIKTLGLSAEELAVIPDGAWHLTHRDNSYDVQELELE